MASGGISAFLTHKMKGWARRWGLVDRPREAGDERSSLPLGGGVAIFFTTTFLLLAALGGLEWVSRFFPERMPEELLLYLPGVRSRIPMLLCVLLGGACVFGLGLVDDRWGLGPVPKILVVTGVAVFLSFNDIRLSFFVSSFGVGMVITVGWVLLVTNAFNLLDNMDGLSAGVAMIAGFLMLGASLQTGHLFVAAYLVVFIGAVFGFLIHNLAPASIFMGDAGSLYVGYTISVLVILSTFYEPAYPVYPIVLPLIILAVPLYDTLSVIVIRFREGRAIFRGDKCHLSHRLVAMGMGVREAVLTIYLLTLSCGLVGLMLYRTDDVGAVIVAAQVILILSVLALLEQTGRRSRR